MDKLLAKARGGAAEELAIRRAALRMYYEAAEGCDDSYGGLGDVARQEVTIYASSDWRSSRIAPDVFWRDFLHWCVAGSNYGLLHGLEAEVFEGAEIHRDRGLVDTILVELIADYTAGRRTWEAEEAQRLRKYNQSGVMPHFRTTGRREFD